MSLFKKMVDVPCPIYDFEWEVLEDWSKLLTGTQDDIYKDYILTFIDNIIIEKSKQFNVPYEQMKKLFKEKNRYFYELIKLRFTKSYSCLKKSSEPFRIITSTFYVPTGLSSEKASISVNIIKDFKRLPKDEQVLLVQRLTNITNSPRAI